MNVEINIWAVALAMVSSMVIGSIWYAKPVFGGVWMKWAKVNPTKRSNAMMPIITTAAVSLVTAYVLAHVTYLSNQFFDDSFLQDALTTAFWMWLGFTAARMLTHDLFEGRPVKLTLLNITHEFVTIMVMGLVIGVMGL